MSDSGGLYDLKVGDRVQVFNVNGDRMDQPKGGWDGTVTKVGRKLITVKYRWAVKVFRLDTGRANDDYGHEWIQTVEQAAESARRSDLIGRLAGYGLRVEYDCRSELPTETLASVVEVLAGSGSGETE